MLQARDRLPSPWVDDCDQLGGAVESWSRRLVHLGAFLVPIRHSQLPSGGKSH